MRYQVVPLTVWIGATAKISYRVVDTHAAQPMNREGVRAWSFDEAVARQICDMLNGVNLHASHRQAEAHKWQGCLDMANRKYAAAARAEADRLRAQLFETREQRDEAREANTLNDSDRLKWKAAYEKAATERDEAQDAEAIARRVPVNVYSSTPPHDHVVMSLANYSKLVTERDEALAKFAACVNVVSFVDDRWVRTS